MAPYYLHAFGTYTEPLLSGRFHLIIGETIIIMRKKKPGRICCIWLTHSKLDFIYVLKLNKAEICFTTSNFNIQFSVVSHHSMLCHTDVTSLQYSESRLLPVIFQSCKLFEIFKCLYELWFTICVVYFHGFWLMYVVT